MMRDIRSLLKSHNLRCVTYHSYTTCRKTSHSYMTCLIGIRLASWLEEWHNTFVHDMPHSGVMWLIHACDETHSWVTQLIRIRHGSVTCDVTRSCVLCDSCTCVMTNSHVWYDSFMNASLLVLDKKNGARAISVGSLFLSTHLHACRCIYVWMSHGTHLHELYMHTSIW